MTKVEKDVKENIEKIMKGTESAIIVTDNGVMIAGEGIRILTSFSLLVNKLKDTIPDKNYLKIAFEAGFEDDGKETKKDVDIDFEEFKKQTDELFKMIDKILGGKDGK